MLDVVKAISETLAVHNEGFDLLSRQVRDLQRRVADLEKAKPWWATLFKAKQGDE